MGKFDKLIQKITNNPKDCDFNDLDKILLKLNYTCDNSGGSHFVYRKKGSDSITLPKQKPMRECYAKLVLKIYLLEKDLK
ncbi:MAG: type II toxin-antitoxin system HicA family toxin [Helicobacter sp.]|nr:type II toxin-antitoxin system HicA family toxin [Helicobacter sp.]